MSTVIPTSGIGPTDAQPLVYVTYQVPQSDYGLQGGGEFDIVPGFMYLMGDVKYRKDQAGNVVAENPNKDGTLPV